MLESQTFYYRARSTGINDLHYSFGRGACMLSLFPSSTAIPDERSHAIDFDADLAEA